MGLLDKIPASLRHTIIIGAAALLTWGSQMLAQAQAHEDVDVTWQSIALGIAAAVVTKLLLVLTPLTDQYGVGKAVPADVPVVVGTDTTSPVVPPGVPESGTDEPVTNGG